MSEETIILSTEGIEQLVEDFKKLARKYPDRTGELLQQEAKKIRKDVINHVKRDKETNKKTKRSLTKASSYKISPVQGYNEKQYVEISARAPHFHLVEHGHEMKMPYYHGIKGQKGVKVPNKNGGQTIGFVPGKHMMADAVREENSKIADVVSDMVDALLQEGGF